MAFKSPQISRLEARLAAIPLAVKEALIPSLERSANEIVGTMRALAPVEDGTLKDSIQWHHSGDLKISIEAGGPTTTRPVRDGVDASYDYALAQEFGTSDQPANSFFFPGYRLERKRAQRRAKRAAGKAIRDAFKKGTT